MPRNRFLAVARVAAAIMILGAAGGCLDKEPTGVDGDGSGLDGADNDKQAQAKIVSLSLAGKDCPTTAGRICTLRVAFKTVSKLDNSPLFPIQVSMKANGGSIGSSVTSSGPTGTGSTSWVFGAGGGEYTLKACVAGTSQCVSLKTLINPAG